ncbi:MAG: glycosyltransferase family 25 protein, partial [Nitrososphaera sp.]|nr:glycosyltransferase family 25 protein [Nitrososphaera sp.]
TMKLDDFFPHKVCINLDRRQDRWERMRARFARHNIGQVVRFPALDGKSLDIPSIWDDFPGAYGCLRSHLAVVEQAREDAQKSVLIFEDDAVLDPQFNTRFAASIKQLPDDWDMVLFGGIHGKSAARTSSNIMRVTHSLSTYAYAMKHTIYDGFIELNRQALTVLDENTRALQKRFNCYCFMPHLAWVEEGYSDVREEKINLWWLSESLVLWGREVDEILEKTVAVISHCRRSEASLKNLSFLVDYFSEKLPSIALLVVETGEEPSLNPQVLPAHCLLEFLKDSGCCQRSSAFNLGFEMFAPSKDFFIFLDSDICLTREDIKANLLKCREYDFASLFSEIFDLNEEDTLKILDDNMRWDYNGIYHPRKKANICHAACIFTRRGMRLIGGWEESDDQEADLTSKKVRPLLRVYDSPNPARRLFHG